MMSLLDYFTMFCLYVLFLVFGFGTMGILESYFAKPTYDILILATVIFVLVLLMTRNRRMLSLVIYNCLLFEMIYVSLHFTARLNNIVITKDVSYQVINYALLLLWLAHLFRKDGFKFAPTPMNLAVFVFFCLCILASYTSPRMFWYYAVEWASRYGASIILFYLVVNFVTTRTRWNIALYVVLAMMFITSVYGYMQVKGYDFMSWGRIVNVSTFGNKDFFASFLTYTTPIALFMAIGSKNWFDAILYLLLAIPGFWNIWTGETRGAYVGLGALAVVWLGWWELHHGRTRRWMGSWQKSLAVIVAGLFLLGGITWEFMSKHRRDTVVSIFQTDRGTNIIRKYMWWTASRMIWDRPVLGQGLGASHVTYPYFRPDRYHRIGMSHNTDYVHSEELQFLCEQGIVGFSAWLAMLIVFFYLCYRKIKVTDDISERYLLFGLAGSFLAAVVHDSMNVNLRWTSSMIAFWFLMGLTARYCLGFEDPEDRKTAQRETRRKIYEPTDDLRSMALAPVVVAAFIFMTYGQYRVLRSDWTLKGTEEGSGPGAAEKGQETLRLNPFSHSAYYKLAYLYLNDNRTDSALSAYNNLLRIAPNYAQTHQNTGLIFYKMFGNTNERKYLYQSILEFEWATILENNFENHTKLLQLYSHLLNDTARGRYHNQYLLWQAVEDAYFSLSLLWRSNYAWPTTSQAERDAEYNEWVKGIYDFSGEYWVYRTDVVRRVGRPLDEVRYAMKMSVRYVPSNVNLMQFAFSTLLSPSNDPDGDLMYLINIVENLQKNQAPPALLDQTRQVLIQRMGSQPASPLQPYAVAILSYRMGDMAGARAYFQMAAASNSKNISFIRDGIKRYAL